MQKRRRRKGESPYLFLELGDLASAFSSQHQSPWSSGLWSQAPLLWPHGEILVVLREQLEQGKGGPRGGSSYQPVLVQMLGACRAWLWAKWSTGEHPRSGRVLSHLSWTGGLPREQQGLAGACSAVDRLCWLLLLPCMATERGGMGSVFSRGTARMWAGQKRSFPDHIFHPGSANSTHQ